MATADSTKCSFIQRESISTNPITYPIKISANEFVFAAENGLLCKLIKFSSNTQSCQELFDFSNYRDCNGFTRELFRGFSGFSYGTLSHDKTKNIYYLYAGECLLEINIITKTMEIYKNLIFEDCVTSVTPVSVFMDDKLHIIGGHDSNKHAIFDPKTKTFIEHYCFDVDGVKHGLSGPGLVYAESKKMLYLMGGYDCGHQIVQERNLDKIWRYSVFDKKWEYLSLTLPVGSSDFPHLITPNERFIVVMLAMRMTVRINCFMWIWKRKN